MDDRPYREGNEQPASIRQVLGASFIGTTIEWYDFFLYGTAATLVFGQLFFPVSTPLINPLSALGVYAVGFVVRPLGGIIFGHYGDRLGRKVTLVLTLNMMGVATFLIGVLPTYNTLGVLARSCLYCYVLPRAWGWAASGAARP